MKRVTSDTVFMVLIKTISAQRQTGWGGFWPLLIGQSYQWGGTVMLSLIADPLWTMDRPYSKAGRSGILECAMKIGCEKRVRK
jgi:hypothetical protein